MNCIQPIAFNIAFNIAIMNISQTVGDSTESKDTLHSKTCAAQKCPIPICRGLVQAYSELQAIEVDKSITLAPIRI
jgi:hypothetical protein